MIKGNDSDVGNIDFELQPKMDKWFIFKKQNWMLLTCDSFPLIRSHLLSWLQPHHYSAFLNDLFWGGEPSWGLLPDFPRSFLPDFSSFFPILSYFPSVPLGLEGLSLFFTIFMQKTVDSPVCACSFYSCLVIFPVVVHVIPICCTCYTHVLCIWYPCFVHVIPMCCACDAHVVCMWCPCGELTIMPKKKKKKLTHLFVHVLLYSCLIIFLVVLNFFLCGLNINTIG